MSVVILWLRGKWCVSVMRAKLKGERTYRLMA